MFFSLSEPIHTEITFEFFNLFSFQNFSTTCTMLSSKLFCMQSSFRSELMVSCVLVLRRSATLVWARKHAPTTSLGYLVIHFSITQESLQGHELWEGLITRPRLQVYTIIFDLLGSLLYKRKYTFTRPNNSFPVYFCL